MRLQLVAFFYPVEAAGAIEARHEIRRYREIHDLIVVQFVDELDRPGKIDITTIGTGKERFDIRKMHRHPYR